jgi:mannitol 2-dehydrogenase
MLTTFAQMRDPALARWIAEHVAFPNCMVDRITPLTTPADIKMVANSLVLMMRFHASRSLSPSG